MGFLSMAFMARIQSLGYVETERGVCSLDVRERFGELGPGIQVGCAMAMTGFRGDVGLASGTAQKAVGNMARR